MSQTSSGIDNPELSDGSKDHEEKDILHSSLKEEDNEADDLHVTNGNEGDDLHGTDGDEVDDLHDTDGNEVDDPHGADASEVDDLHANEVDDQHSTDVNDVDLHGIDKLIQEGERDGALALMGSSTEDKQQDASLPPSKGDGKKQVKQKKPYKKRPSLAERPDSPTTQRIQQRLRYVIIQDAYDELVKMRKVNGGPKHGDLAMIVKKYNNELGHSFVTRAVLSNKLSQKITSSKGPKDDDSFYSAAASEQEGEEDQDTGSSMDESLEPKKRKRKGKTLSTKKKKHAVATSKKRKKVISKKGGKRTSSSSPRKRRKIDYDSTEDEDEDDDDSSDSAEDEDDESSQSSSADRVQRMIHKSIIDDAYAELLKLPGGAKKKENIKMIVDMYQELNQTFVTQAAIKKRMTGKASPAKTKATKSKSKKSSKSGSSKTKKVTDKKKLKAAKKGSVVKVPKARSKSQQAKSAAYQLRQAIIRQAFIDLKALRASHGDESYWGDIPKIIHKYHEKGHTFVTRETLRHRFAKERKREAELAAAAKKKKKKERVEPTSDILKAIFAEAAEDRKLSEGKIPNVKTLDAKARREILMQACDELIELREQNGAKTYGDIQTIVRKYRRNGYLFVTRDRLNYRLLLRNKPKEDGNEKNERSVKKTTTPKKPSSKPKSKVKGKKKKKKVATKAKGKDIEVKVREGISKCAKLLKREKESAREKGVTVQAGTFQRIIEQVENELGLPPNSINGRTVVQRVVAQKRKVTGESSQKVSPLKAIEPTIIQYCQRLLKMGVELEKHQVILLTESLIRSTTHRDKSIEFKKNTKLLDPARVYAETELVVGDSWFKGFMKRNHDFLSLPSNLAVKRHIHQPQWCTYDNLKALYDSVYDAMVDEARVAIRLDDATSFNRDGNQVEPGDDSAFGLPTQYMVTKPNNIVYINEVEVMNLSVKGKNAVVGHKVVLPLEEEISSGAEDEIIKKMLAPTSATVLCFSSGSGVPIMCAVVFASDLNIGDMPHSWKYGIDITKQLKGDSTTDADDILWSQNSGDGEAMAGGPVCYFEGKRIPCYTECSPTGAINSEMFVDMLKYLDGLNVFDRSDGTKPFLLLDGHHCILDLQLINYVNDHGWVLRLGLPYGVSYWQRIEPNNNDTYAPGSSMYPILMNYDGGGFGRALIEAQHKYLNLKTSCKGFQKSDVIPLINDAWSKSLADVNKTRNTICDHGWGPLTYNILQHPKVIVTVPDADAAEGQPEHEGNMSDDEDQAAQEGGPQLSANSLAAEEDATATTDVQPEQEGGRTVLSSDEKESAAEVQPAQDGPPQLSTNSLAAPATDHFAAADKEEEDQPAQDDRPLLSNDSLAVAKPENASAEEELSISV